MMRMTLMTRTKPHSVATGTALMPVAGVAGNAGRSLRGNEKGGLEIQANTRSKKPKGVRHEQLKSWSQWPGLGNHSNYISLSAANSPPGSGYLQPKP